MPRKQTSIRVSPRAALTLDAIASSWSVSRDAAVRRLLAGYLETQSTLAEDDRSIHISTLLRYPPIPPGRTTPDGRVRVAVRLDEGVADAASALALRLPGQAQRQAHHDYAGRPLTDACLCAITVERPYEEIGLEGLPSVLRHREALGLWRLVVAATATLAEERALRRPTDPRVPVALREEGVGWHSPWRFEVAAHLARRLLVGPQRERNRAMLWDQTSLFEALEHDLFNTVDFDHELLAGLDFSTSSAEGRGGGAVWRAERAVARTAIAAWLRSSRSRSHVVKPPGWRLSMPAGWSSRGVSAQLGIPPALMADLAAGRVVLVDGGSRSSLWPYGPYGAFADFSVVTDVLGARASEDVVETVLVRFDALLAHPRVPAATAHTLGFISASERDRLIRDAANANKAEIAGVLLRARRLNSDNQVALRRTSSSPWQFGVLARSLGLRCHIVEPHWTWEIASLAHALDARETAARIRWLTDVAWRIREVALERDMREAALKAYWLGHTYDEV